MSTESDAKRKAAATYNAAADCYDHPALSFWERFGRRTVQRLALRPGLEVLDACCGSGASALPAAAAVAPGGRVLAVDLADRLVELGRRKSRVRGLDNLEFRVADVEALKLPDASFDAVVCVFGIFFLPDMAKAVRELWRMVRQGGRLAITTWGANFFEPANTAFWESVRSERPELFKAFHPWDRINESTLVERLLEEGGAKTMEVAAEFARLPLGSPEDWWSIVLGSGYRGTVEQMPPEVRERVRRANLSYLHEHDVRFIQANVIYGIATKSPASG
jgi:ubiquinone/menaquinone biosynthesis C-methylase UbiE